MFQALVDRWRVISPFAPTSEKRSRPGCERKSENLFLEFNLFFSFLAT
jgi:hypothetical protein